MIEFSQTKAQITAPGFMGARGDPRLLAVEPGLHSLGARTKRRSHASFCPPLEPIGAGQTKSGTA